MLKFQGGRLKFAYRNGELEVGTESLEVYSQQKTDNQKQILEWFNNNEDDLGLEVVEKGESVFIFAFPDELKDDVDASLYRERLDFEID